MTTVAATADAEKLRHFLDGEHRWIRERVRAVLSTPEFAPVSGITREEHRGCFAMTETGHGSNVQALGTTATYDREAGEFVVHTPDEESRKDYIGNAALHGRIAAVFAQLEVGGESHGVHCLLVPLRDD